MAEIKGAAKYFDWHPSEDRIGNPGIIGVRPFQEFPVVGELYVEHEMVSTPGSKAPRDDRELQRFDSLSFNRAVREAVERGELGIDYAEMPGDIVYISRELEQLDDVKVKSRVVFYHDEQGAYATRPVVESEQGRDIPTGW